MNLIYLREIIGVEIGKKELIRLDWEAGRLFKELTKQYGLKGIWWYEYERRH
jgi:hypothetical protein